MAWRPWKKNRSAGEAEDVVELPPEVGKEPEISDSDYIGVDDDSLLDAEPVSDDFEPASDGLAAAARAAVGTAVGTTSVRQSSLGRFSFGAGDGVVDEDADDDDDIDESPGFLRRRKLAKAMMETFDEDGVTLKNFPHLMAMKPRERYVFRSDYFEVDDEVGCILSFFHDDAARDNFGAFWGVNRVPSNLSEPGEPPVTVIVFDHATVMDDAWVEQRLRSTERQDKLAAREQAASGSLKGRRKTQKMSDDREMIAAELEDGAKYLNVHNRVLLRTTTVEHMDKVIDRLTLKYIRDLGTVHAAPYHGEQRRELSELFAWVGAKRGKPFGYTSVEYAGNYNLVTNGLDDPTGESVGMLVGDLNNSAILFDVDKWSRRVVVADGGLFSRKTRQLTSDAWASKISQAALKNNHRVIHIVLNNADLDKLGPAMSSLTTRLNLNRGEINPFELFGDVDEELSIFNIHVEKIVLMTMQLLGIDKSEGLRTAAVRARLSELLREFYVDQRMWHPNAAKNRDKLRLVNLAHDSVPKLEVFVTYLNTAYEGEKGKNGDPAVVDMLRNLRDAFQTMLYDQGDLFNNVTSDNIDQSATARRLIYDFSAISRRGHHIAMAQLVNVVSFAMSSLRAGDVVIFHGAQQISDPDIKSFIHREIENLQRKGGRVALCYDSIDDFLAHQDFNCFDDCDYTLLGRMTTNQLNAYEMQLAQVLPEDLKQLIDAHRADSCNFLRRGVNNVYFHRNLTLGINPARLGDTEAIADRAEADEIHGVNVANKYRGGGTAEEYADTGGSVVLRERQRDLRKAKLARAGDRESMSLLREKSTSAPMLPRKRIHRSEPKKPAPVSSVTRRSTVSGDDVV